MSALSGITVSADLAAVFAEAVQSNSTRFIKVMIHNEFLVHDLSIPVSDTLEHDLDQLQSEDVLQADFPAYVLAKLDSPSPDWLIISYVPDTAQVRSKMLYASTRLPLLKSLGSMLFADSIFATSKDDLTSEAYASHKQHAAAPHPLSVREQELAVLRAAENEIASYEGSRTRASHVGTGVGLNWSEEVEKMVIELSRGNGDSLVILSIDPTTETLTLHSATETSVTALGASLPPSEPCYAFFAWNHSFGSNPLREIVFIYSCPSSSPIKHRMLYSSGSASTYQAAKDILATSPRTANLASRKIETSDPNELDEALLKLELGFPTPSSMSSTLPVKPAVAVYCGSSTGKYPAFTVAAASVGRALALDGRILVYGGGTKGIMGIVSGAVLEQGGDVIGVIPKAMLIAGGEGEKGDNPLCVDLKEVGREKVHTIVVESMHERKVEMAERVEGFIGLPGGFGTFEEVLEVTTWSQLGIHDKHKAVVLLNVLSFWEPLRVLIKSSIDAGFIRPASESLVLFVDGPVAPEDHESFDWGKAALDALKAWEGRQFKPLFDWSKKDGHESSYGRT
ncbi:hypothetical protein NLJ89_g945 [Agrocybe chaxingu]|uniref:ADF-H domain-containing protein n=1 Tax=Agrocybe chaxingu TaxID=84603 RepID=A0A9W8N0Z8_9AGAR|nr:hypothetical protein NLJ89_g945 [Agrocybe chaxingu]